MLIVQHPWCFVKSTAEHTHTRLHNLYCQFPLPHSKNTISAPLNENMKSWLSNFKLKISTFTNLHFVCMRIEMNAFIWLSKNLLMVVVRTVTEFGCKKMRLETKVSKYATSCYMFVRLPTTLHCHFTQSFEFSFQCRNRDRKGSHFLGPKWFWYHSHAFIQGYIAFPLF